MKFFNKSFIYCLFCGGLILISAGAGYGADEENDFLSDDFYETWEEFSQFDDPLEPFNRAMFQFNDVTFTYILNPVAQQYAYVVPYDIRGIVGNFFRNLEEPARFVNCLLQGRLSDAGTVAVRFFVNTLGGVAGLGDPAGRELGFSPVEASLCETFYVWGIGDGAYIVIPFYGPSTLRDFTGTVIDGLAMTPYYSFTDRRWVRVVIDFGKETNNLSLNLGLYEKIKSLSLDPYIAIRSGYFQNRDYLRGYR
jgi:phospholipid-binding lipoprotein MlaA